MAKATGSDASNIYFQNEKLRQSVRDDIYQEALDAQTEGRELNEAYTDELSAVYESIPYTYAEQGYNSKYVKLLKEKYKFETGKEFKGAGQDIKQLIDEDFSDWNFVVNNLSLNLKKKKQMLYSVGIYGTPLLILIQTMLMILGL